MRAILLYGNRADESDFQHYKARMVSSRTQLITQHSGLQALSSTETASKMQFLAVTGGTTPALDTKGQQITEKIRKFFPLCDFDFTIERELAGEPGGYVLQVKRSTDGWQKRVVISSSDCKRAVDFELAIEKGMGVDVSCNLRTDQLKALLRERRLAYRYRVGITYQLANQPRRKARQRHLGVQRWPI
ncbi:hypothetical protein IQ264_01175 [Phormidium sp. LEGE 05292]|uniref:hypothetical protein n=1 Tax=[Phormidium] sp. LEGE 05292 TaxID=767427 RepID=UPI0018827D00|nr:hypothetical protein [Phormidium sp. LEGE 05292]MBE9224084.1 hypothetical protein [Phormidium sp. LEGE 05292]